MKTSKEYIVAAAILMNWHAIVGKRHSNCFVALRNMTWIKVNPSGIEQWFYTSNRKFVDRYDAMDIAIEAGQVKWEQYKSWQILFSEDLR